MPIIVSHITDSQQMRLWSKVCLFYYKKNVDFTFNWSVSRMNNCENPFGLIVTRCMALHVPVVGSCCLKPQITVKR